MFKKQISAMWNKLFSPQFEVGDYAQTNSTKKIFRVDKIIRSPKKNRDFDILCSSGGIECRAKNAKRLNNPGDEKL